MEEASLIHDVFEQIKVEILTFYKGLQRMQKAGNVEDEFARLHSKLQELLQLTKKFEGSRPESGVNLSEIDKYSKYIVETMSVIRNQANEVYYLLQNFKEARPGELVSIIDIKKKGEDWVVKIRSDKCCENNFRNIEIWDVTHDIMYSKFKLLEPKCVLKRNVRSEDIVPSSYIVAKVNGNIVSKPFFLPKVNISVNNDDGELKIEIINHFGEDLENLTLVYKEFEDFLIQKVEGFSCQKIPIPIPECEHIYAFIVEKEQVISNILDIKLNVQDEEDENENQPGIGQQNKAAEKAPPRLAFEKSPEQIAQELADRHSGLNPADILNGFINPNPGKSLEFYEQLLFENGWIFS